MRRNFRKMATRKMVAILEELKDASVSNYISILAEEIYGSYGSANTELSEMHYCGNYVHCRLSYDGYGEYGEDGFFVSFWFDKNGVNKIEIAPFFYKWSYTWRRGQR